MKPNRIALTLAILLTLTLAARAGMVAGGKLGEVVVATPADQELGLTLGLGYDSAHVFRGAEFGGDWLTGALSLDLAIGESVSATFDTRYGALAGRDESFVGGADFDRIEAGAGVTYSGGLAEVGLGYRWYHPDGDITGILEDGHEAGLTLGTSVGPVNIGLGSYHDFSRGGWYFEAAMNAEVKVTDRFAIVPGASLGRAIDYGWQVRDLSRDGFTHLGVSLAFPVQVTSRATLTPYIAMNFPLSALDGTFSDDDRLYGGVSLRVRF